MRNYSRKTNKKLTRYRTPSRFKNKQAYRTKTKSCKIKNK